MKVWIDKDEWYPMYTFYTKAPYGGGVEADLPDGFVEGFDEVMQRLGAMQNRLEELYEEGKHESSL